MSYTEICEGSLTCTSYEKCTQQYEKTGIDKCIKKTKFKQYACNGDDCTNCNNKTECELILKTSKSLTQTQKRIGEIITRLKRIQKDITYIRENPEVRLYGIDLNTLILTKEDLTEELRSLRQEEFKKLKILRNRRKI